MPAPSDVKVFVNFEDNANLDIGAGVVTATLRGTGAVASGQLQCRSGTPGSVDWAYASNGPADENIGCIRFEFTPQVTGNQAGQTFIELGISGTNNHRLAWYIGTTGGDQNKITIRIFDGSGIVLSNTNHGVFQYQAGTKYTFELNFDFTTGASRVFRDGILQGSLITQLATRTGSDVMTIGINVDQIGGSPKNSDMDADNFVFFDTPQHTLDHASEIPFSYSSFLPPDGPPLCAVTGFLRDEANQPLVGAVVTARPTRATVKYVELQSSGGFNNALVWVISGVKTATTDSDGFFTLSLAQGLPSIFFTAKTSAGVEVQSSSTTGRLTIAIPAVSTIDITALFS